MRGSSQKIKREQLSENMHEKQEPMLVGLQVQPGAKGCRDQRAGRSLGKKLPLERMEVWKSEWWQRRRCPEPPPSRDSTWFLCLLFRTAWQIKQGVSNRDKWKHSSEKRKMAGEGCPRQFSAQGLGAAPQRLAYFLCSLCSLQSVRPCGLQTSWNFLQENRKSKLDIVGFCCCCFCFFKEC